MSIADGVTDHGKTIRQRAVEELKAKIAAMTDGGEPVWQKVVYGDLDDVDNTQCPIVGVDFGTEIFEQIEFPAQRFTLPMIVNFRFQGKHGVDEHVAYMYYLGLLQFALLGDHNLGGLALNVEEDSNAPTIVGIQDVYPGGTLLVNVTYRTRLHNPFKLKHEP